MIANLVKSNKNFILLEFPDIYQRFQRLKGVGGFISILGPDPRVPLFCRYNHVERVVNLADLVIGRLGLEEYSQKMLLAYFHDINRLPLTYVTEKVLGYSQSSYIYAYLRGCRDEIPEEYMKSLKALMDKDIDYSPDTRFIYLCDMVVNFIEDILFFMVLLNISPSYLSHGVLSAAGLDSNEEEFANDVEYLKLYFSEDNSSFSQLFQDISLKYMLTFIQRLGGIEIFISGSPVEKSGAVLTLRDYLKNIVIPAVDEVVVKEKVLIKKIIRPYSDRLKREYKNPYEQLWAINDEEFLNLAVEMGLIKRENMKEFCPALASPAWLAERLYTLAY